MARRKKGREISGWLCLDKGAGRTSTQVLSVVKRLYGAAKAGHAGTLDPLATGALPIAFGEATKTVSFVQEGRKLYRFTVHWGVETDTDDAEGRATATSDARPSREAIEAAIPAFIGEIMQRPPAYSAIKLAGERAYDKAREGEEVDIPERPVVVYDLRLVEIPDADHAVFEAECGKGTYVRAIARDMGRQLGCLGHVSALRRLAVGPFGESMMVKLEDLEARAETDGPASLDVFLVPISQVLGDLPEVPLSPPEAARLRRGQSVLMRGRDALSALPMVHATLAGESVAIGAIEQGAFHPKRVFR